MGTVIFLLQQEQRSSQMTKLKCWRNSRFQENDSSSWLGCDWKNVDRNPQLDDKWPHYCLLMRMPPKSCKSQDYEAIGSLTGGREGVFDLCYLIKHYHIGPILYVFFTLLTLKFIYIYIHFYLFIYYYYYHALGALNIYFY